MQPKFDHPADSPEGRMERAVWVLRNGESRGVPVAVTIGWLKERRGLTFEEITAALYTAAG